MSGNPDPDPSLPPPSGAAKVARGAMQVVGGAIPLFGGMLSAAAGAWSEREQERVNRIFEHWVKMLQEELREKQRTIVEITTRLDMSQEELPAASRARNTNP